MANITAQDNIRYCIDSLDPSSYGLFISDSFALDCSAASSVKGFALDYSMPTGTAIKFLFHVDNNWVKLKTNGEAEIISNSTPDYDLVSQNGNTPAELLALTNIPALAGKRFGVAIALFAQDPDNAIPRVKLSAKCETDNQVLKTSKLSPVYSFNDAQIIKFNTPISVAGSGSVSVLAQTTDKDGKISEWLPVENFNGQKISKLQLRADYSVNDLTSSSSASLTNAQMIYSLGNSITEGAANGELISLTENWYMNIKECRMNVKHDPLINSNIRAYCALRKTPTIIRNEQLGIGTGARKTFQLAHVDGLEYDTVRLYYDNVQTYSDYEINSQVGRITCNAPEGVIVSCDYEYGWDSEDWREMNLTHRVSYMDYDNSEYKITLDDNSLSVCAVKLVLEMTSGTITKENIGKGTGKTQTYKLSKHVDGGSITIYQNNSALASKNYSLHDDTQYISISANNGATLTATYKWISDSPTVHQFAAIFSE